MSDQQEQNRELKEAFIRHLPERVATIENQWEQLTRDHWESERLEQLHLIAQELIGSSGRFGLIQLSESAFALETFLSSFINSKTPPEDHQADHGQQLITSLKQCTEGLKSGPAATGSRKKSVFFARKSDDIAPGLTAILEERGCSVLTFLHPDDVEGEITKHLPRVLIIDADFLQQIGPLNRELALQQERHNREVGIICISSTRDLEKRLLALRSGVDAYYLTPVNNQEIAEKVLELATPVEAQYRILVVEDDISQAKFATAILEKHGMITRTETQPLAVLESVEEFRPDLILMDLYMPNADGIELTTIIREHPDFVTTPIVFLSGEHDTDKQLHALSSGGDDFLSKPIRPRHLINTITNRVQRARALESRGPKHSSRDPVTGLFNRRYFFERLDGVLANRRSHPLTGGVLFLTLNTDEIRRDAGNEKAQKLLAELGTLITDQLEEQDVPARVGDDDFTIMLIRPHQKNLLKIAEKLAASISWLTSREGGSLALKPRIGIATFTSSPDDAAGLVTNARLACHQLLLDSIPPVRLYDATAATSSEQGAAGDSLPGMIEDALKKGSLQLLFHPLVERESGATGPYEVAVRLPTSGGEQPSDTKFQSAVKEAGLTEKIDRWILNRCLTTLEEKRNEGKQITLLIPQSGQPMHLASTVTWLMEQLRTRQMVGSGLVFEYPIAELGADLKSSKKYLSDLQGMGIGIALGRFGANGAAFRVLQFLQAEYVRIARPILKADIQGAQRVIEEIHLCSARVLLPERDETQLPAHWLSGADFIPGQP